MIVVQLFKSQATAIPQRRRQGSQPPHACAPPTLQYVRVLQYSTNKRSCRPGAAEVSPEEEISRVVPVIEGIRAAATAGGEAAAGEGDDVDTDTIGPVTITVDTRRAAVAEAAVAAGADAVNDVSGGTFDPRMLATVARAGVPLMMMHMR